MDRLALRLPLEAALNVIPILQMLPFATLLPQGLVGESAKSAEFVPVKVIGFIVKAEVPVFVSVTVSAELVVFTRWTPKSRLAGTSITVPVVTVMLALLDFVLSETEAAVRVTGLEDGTEPGAV
jgi:hypothetical protein